MTTGMIAVACPDCGASVRILPEDWAGESGFFKGRDGYWWYILCIQAEAEHESDPLGRKVGEYLWTEWFNTEGNPGACTSKYRHLLKAPSSNSPGSGTTTTCRRN